MWNVALIFSNKNHGPYIENKTLEKNSFFTVDYCILSKERPSAYKHFLNLKGALIREGRF